MAPTGYKPHKNGVGCEVRGSRPVEFVTYYLPIIFFFFLRIFVSSIHLNLCCYVSPKVLWNSCMVLQVEYYLSDENLPNDKYMTSLIKKNKEGFGKSLSFYGLI